jgi:hypothetical protein
MARVTFLSLAIGQIRSGTGFLASFYEDDMLPLLLGSLNIHCTTSTCTGGNEIGKNKASDK